MRKIIPLNSGWEFHLNYRDEYLEKWYKVKSPELVDFPHSIVDMPFNGFDEKIYQYIFSYRKLVNIPNEWKGKVIRLMFGGVATNIEVYCNGRLCASHNGAYLPFEADLTDKVIYGENNLLVFKVDSYEDDEVPPYGGAVDYLTYAGVYREVTLEVLNPEFISDIYTVTADVCGDKKYWETDIEVSSVNLQNRLRLTLMDGGNNTVAVLCEENLRDRTMSFKGEISDVRLWDISHPVLYGLKAELLRDAEVLDEITLKVGFRKIDITPEGFIINDRKIKLIGLNRHQSYPHAGYAMPKSAQEDDADYLKSIGLNVVRSSHYPPSVHFLNRCDEIGLLVIEEIPGWQHIGAGKSWRDRCVKNVRDMIVRDRNHPSVIMWGVRINESPDDDELYTRTNRTAHDYDPSRPTCGVRNFAGSNLLEDVYTFNDFSNNGGRCKILKKKEVTKTSAPYMITEFNGHMYPTKSYDNEERRLEHALRHADILDRVMGSPDILGATGWCMADYNTHGNFGSGDGVCYHGVADMYRMSKLAAYVYKSQSDDSPIMEISGSMNIGDYSGGFIDEVYAFTNCDYIKVYSGGQLTGAFYPDRKRFRNLKYPPIKITDFIGDKFIVNHGFSSANSRRAKKIIRAVLKYGQANMPFKYKISMALLLLTQRISFNEAREILTKYVGGLGAAGTEYLFEGYKNDDLVLSVTKGLASKTYLNAVCSKLTLSETETYDTAKINISFIDEHGNQLNYINESVKIVVSGAIKVIGPDIISVKGGAASVWVRSGAGGGKAKITLSSPYGGQELNFEVTKALAVK